MDIQVEKYKLIEWIMSLQDISLINHLNAFREELNTDWWEDLSQEEREGIEQGLRDIEEGRVYPHEEVMSGLKKRFKL